MSFDLKYNVRHTSITDNDKHVLSFPLIQCMQIKVSTCDNGFAYRITSSYPIEIDGNGATFTSTLEDCGFISMTVDYSSFYQTTIQNFKTSGDVIETDTQGDTSYFQE